MRGGRVLIVGYHGMGNVGAELRLSVLVKDIKKANPNAEITVAAFRYHDVIPIDDVKYIFLNNTFTAALETIIHIPKFDYIICGEGIPFVDFCGMGFIDYFIPILNAAHRFRKKTACYAFDIDSMSRKHLKRSIKILKKVDILMVRSKASMDYLKKKGLKYNIQLGTDASMLFDIKKPKRKKDSIGICLKDFYCYPIKPKFFGKKEDLYHYPHYYTYEKNGKRKYKSFVENMAKMIDQIMEDNKKIKIKFMVMESQMDYRVTKEVYNLIKNQDRVEIVSRETHSINEILSKFSEMKCLVSSRYHSVLLGVRSRVPVLVLSTDERFDYFMKDIGLERFLIDVYKENINMSRIKRFIEKQTGKKEFSEKLKRKLPILEKRAEKNYEVLKELFKR